MKTFTTPEIIVPELFYIMEFYEKNKESFKCIDKYFQMKNNWIGRLPSYLEKHGKEKTQELFAKPPKVTDTQIKMEACCIAAIQCKKLGLEPPDWINSDEFSNTWRTPYLNFFGRPLIVNRALDEMNKNDSLFLEHAVLSKDIDYDVV